MVSPGLINKESNQNAHASIRSHQCSHDRDRYECMYAPYDPSNQKYVRQPHVKTEIDSLAPFLFSNQKSPSCSTWSTTPHAPSLQSPPPPRTFGTRWSRGCCFCSGNSRDGCCRPPPELVKEQPRGLSAARSLGRLRWSRLTTRPRESDGVQQKRGLRAACNARADAGIACRVPCVCASALRVNPTDRALRRFDQCGEADITSPCVPPLPGSSDAAMRLPPAPRCAWRAFESVI